MVKIVTKSTFDDIKALFPKAHSLPVTCNKGQIQPCPLCKEEEDSLSNFPNDLMTLVKAIVPILSPSPINIDTPRADDTHYLVHCTELKRLEKLVNMVNKKCPAKKGKEIALGKELHSKIVGDFLDEKSKWKVHSLLSKQGQAVVPTDTIMQLKDMQDFQRTEDVETYAYGSVTILSETLYGLYQQFTTRLEQVMLSLDSNENTNSPNQSSSNNGPRHPKVTFQNGNLVWYPALCQDTDRLTCESDSPDLQVHTKTNEKQTEPDLVQIVDDDVKNIEPDKTPTKTPNNEDTFFYRIHEFDCNYALETIQSILEKHHSDANEALNSTKQSYNKPRRSTRRRKQPMDTFDMHGNKEDNLAYFRICIDQNCKSDNLVYQNLCLFRYDAMLEEKSILCPLLHERNVDEMKDVLEIVKDAPCIEIILHGERPNKRKRKSSDGKKKENGISDDTAVATATSATTTTTIDGNLDNMTHDDLFQNLWQMAKSKEGGLLDLPEQNNDNKGRTMERGFQGTFLQSSTLQQQEQRQQRQQQEQQESLPVEQNGGLDDDDNDDDDPIQIVGTQFVKKKPPPTEVVIG